MIDRASILAVLLLASCASQPAPRPPKIEPRPAPARRAPAVRTAAPGPSDLTITPAFPATLRWICSWDRHPDPRVTNYRIYVNGANPLDTGNVLEFSFTLPRRPASLVTLTACTAEGLESPPTDPVKVEAVAFRLQWHTEDPEASFSLWSSPDLVHWLPAGTVSGNTAVIGSIEPHEFYKVTLP